MLLHGRAVPGCASRELSALADLHRGSQFDEHHVGRVLRVCARDGVFGQIVLHQHLMHQTIGVVHSPAATSTELGKTGKDNERDERQTDE